MAAERKARIQEYLDKHQRFDTGRIVMTPGVLELEKRFTTPVTLACLLRHIEGDWGDLDDHDRIMNDHALETGDGRLFSSYQLDESTKLWIITEWDRSVTTLLLPEEY